MCGELGRKGVIKQHLLVTHWSQRICCSSCDNMVATRRRGAPEPCLKCAAAATNKK